VTKTQSAGPISCLEHRATRVLHSSIVTRAAVLMFPLLFQTIFSNQMRPRRLRGHVHTKLLIYANITQICDTNVSQSASRVARARTLRSSDVPLLIEPFTRTELAECAFRHPAPTVWNSLPKSIINCDSLPVFKCRLKTYFFCLAFN